MQDSMNEQQLMKLLLQRECDMFEQGAAMQTLCQKYGHTQATLARKLGVSQSYIGNKIRLLQFSAHEQELIRKYALTERHARVILRVTPSQRINVITAVGNMHLTVHQTEEFVDQRMSEHNFDIKCEIIENSLSANAFLQRVQAGAERLRTVGYKTTCLTESGENWQRITVMIVE
jgi:ParB family chromosome partitioning protein